MTKSFSLFSFFGWQDLRTVRAPASPGLMTLLDMALYRSNEGCLTGTVCAANVLLCAFLDLKKSAQELLHLLLSLPYGESVSGAPTTTSMASLDQAESFARLCLECASGAIERLTTDKLALSANLPVENSVPGLGASSSSSGIGSSSASASGPSSGVVDASEGVLEAVRTMDSGRARQQRRVDCWESPRLFCPDYVWADDAITYCQRLVRAMSKHRFFSAAPQGVAAVDPVGGTGWSALSPSCLKVTGQLCFLVGDAIPVRLHQFRAAAEADTVVSKRLYLVKCEYRAPFRAFLEAHNTVQRAPAIEMVDEYIRIHKEGSSKEFEAKKKKAEKRIQKALENPALVESLKIEQQCEMLEVGMARMLLPFAELARLTESKKAKLHAVPGVLSAEHVPNLRELLRRLKSILTRKPGNETSVGIRPILIDLQGIPRDLTLESSEIFPFGRYTNQPEEEAIKHRLESLVSQLKTICDLGKTKGGFQIDKKDLEIPSAILRSCSSLDSELFIAHYEDWHSLVKRQRELAKGDKSFHVLAENMRRAEIEVSIAMASQPSLMNVRQRLENHEKDRMKRFEVLKELLQEVCLREMDIRLDLIPPEKDLVLELPETSALGLFGAKLLMAGETLPLG